jgi:isohexenylglutaconyl-CoA hydratase
MKDLPKTKDLILNSKNGWLDILFDNVENRNALKDNLIEELFIVFDLIRNDKRVRGVVLRGNGGVFCSGADLKGIKEITSAGESAKQKAFDLSMNIGNLLSTINKAPQVVISVTEGYAFAGGFGIACASDFVISLPDTKFALTETKIGLTPSQISKYVVRKLGYSCAKKMMLLGTVVDGSSGFDIGLVDYLALNENELEEVINIVKSKVLECSPNALAITKKVLSLDDELDLEKAADLFSDTIISDDGKEGFESFFEKRSPNWRND